MTDRDELRRLRDAISAVRKLHREVTIEEFELECVLGMCGHKLKCPTLVVKGCAHCGPPPTPARPSGRWTVNYNKLPIGG